MIKEYKPAVADKWGLPGGKLEEGESLREALRREVQEETGFSVTAENLIRIVNKPHTHEGNTVVRCIFQCTIDEAPSSAAEHDYEFLPITKLEELEKQGLIRGQEVLPILKEVSSAPPANHDELLLTL